MDFQEVDNGLIEKRNLIATEFDIDFYLAHSPDLHGSDQDPVLHYLQHGWREHRDPSARFSTSYYLEVNHDVVKADVNPFYHYVAWGRAEGRHPKAVARRFIEQANIKNETKTQDDYTVQSEQPAGGGYNAADIAIAQQEFDVDFYIDHSPDLRGTLTDPVLHYLCHGWRELRDPSPDFSTSYYLTSNPDVKDGGINPFLHYLKFGRAEGRPALSYSAQIAMQEYRPLVTAIVPNYNHAKYLRQRIASIINQSYNRIEIVILDDGSTDESAELIELIQDETPDLIRVIVNEVNSGNVFKQWRRGVAAARGELIWICESDDFCEPDFLASIVPSLIDRSVMMAFGRIQLADSHGAFVEGLDDYREDAEPGLWSQNCVRTARDWFNGAFGVSNVIPNVGGCVFRNLPLPDEIWAEAQTYKILGDWYLYVMLAEGGRICYVPDAVAYFRQHGHNTSVRSFLTQGYYREHAEIIKLLRHRWGASNLTTLRFGCNVIKTYEHAHAEKHVGELTSLFSFDHILAQKRNAKHILVAFLGFHLGGGELFPIHLANELLRRGYIVSVMCLDTRNENPRVRAMLDPRIAIYEARQIEEIGVAPFIDQLGADLIHSHGVGIEFFFFKDRHLVIKPPYVVTLHGSYECTPISDDILLKMIRGVSHWVYLSKKNLDHLRGLPLSSKITSFIGNGMPLDPREPAVSRADLGIGENDLVFTIISRAMREKGWYEAIQAITAAQLRSNRRLHLILCGTGPELDALGPQYVDDAAIHFLGFQETVHGIFRLSDCALLPTRFKGESFPLCLIQAMQVGTPIIATAIGEIESMLFKSDYQAGITVMPLEDNAAYVTHLASAMLMMSDDSFRKERAADAAILGRDFDMETVADKYVDLYNDIFTAPAPR